MVQHLGQGGAHARALAGGKDDAGEGACAHLGGGAPPEAPGSTILTRCGGGGSARRRRSGALAVVAERALLTTLAPVAARTVPSMLAILGGGGAAFVFAIATICESRSSRMIGPASLLAWVMIVGLAITGPLLALGGAPAGLDERSAAWLAVAGVATVSGLLLAYAALRRGKVGVVAPIVSTEGSIAAVFAVAAGERIASAAAAALGVIAVGIVLAALARETPGIPARPAGRRAALYAIAAAFAFGTSLYATAQVSLSLPLVWALIPARVTGVVVVALPLAATARLRLTRPAAPLVLVSGICEVAGAALFAFGARHDIAVSAVLASQFAAIAAVAAYFLFHERLARAQLAGVATIVAGVAALSMLQA